MRERLDCRACHRVGLVEILNLGDQPPANAYLSSVDQPEQRYPLSLRLCESCGMVQLGHIVDPDLLFRDYSFRTSSSARMVEHFSKLMCEVAEPIPHGGLLVEIGANDGVALASVAGRVRVLGVDPAGIPADVPMLAEPFTARLSEQIERHYGKADAIVACNVLGHVDDLDDLLAGVASLLQPDGTFVFEVPYLGEFLDRSEFDTVYHEHLSYLSARPLLCLLERAGLRLERIDRQEVHGGSIRCRATKGTGQGDGGHATNTGGTSPTSNRMTCWPRASYLRARGSRRRWPTYETPASESSDTGQPRNQPCVSTSAESGRTCCRRSSMPRRKRSAASCRARISGLSRRSPLT